MKQVCKSFSSGETNAHVVGDCLVLTTIRVITHGPQCSAKISFIYRKAKHVASIYDVSNKKDEHVKGWQLLIGHLEDDFSPTWGDFQVHLFFELKLCWKRHIFVASYVNLA